MLFNLGNINKIEETYFADYYSHPIESGKMSAIAIYFASCYTHPTTSNKINICNN